MASSWTLRTVVEPNVEIQNTAQLILSPSPGPSFSLVMLPTYYPLHLLTVVANFFP